MMNTNLPDKWKIVHIDEICSINKDTLSEKNADFQFKYIDLSSVKSGKILCSAPISFKGSPSRARRIIRKNDIIMSTVRPNLQGFAHIDFDAQEYICSTGFAVLTVKPNISSKFIYYCLYSKSVETQINNMLVGSNYPAINSSDVASLRIFLPPLAEQEKIAEILSCWDEGIEKLSALIEKKKIQKKALMQQLLTGKHRLKGFATPWHEVKLGDIGIISSAGVDKKIIEGEKFVYLLNYMDVYKKNFLYTCDVSMVVSANARQIIKCNLKKGDIFFTPSSETRDDIAHSAVVMEDIINGVYSYHIIRLRPTTHIDLKFTAYAFKTNLFYKQAFSICEGSGQRYVISQDYFRNMTVFIPSSLAEQKAIADILSKSDEEIELLNKKLEAFKLEKKALMQKLLTGKIRVKGM